MNIFYKKGLLLDVLLFPLIIVSVFFQYIIMLRRKLYQKGFIKSYRPRAKVISVGNLTVGGTGKTPMVIHLCTLLKSKKIGVVARGYKAKVRGVVLVSDGTNLLCTPETCGDEPYLIARSARHAVVAVSANKTEAVRFMDEHYQPDIIILDDGFSHLQVQRDMEILLIDGDKGFGNRHALPAGPLRELVRSIQYADVIGVKGGTAGLLPVLDRFHIQDKTFSFYYTMDAIKSIDRNEPVDIKGLQDKKSIAMAGIAFPEQFFDALSAIGIKPVQCIAKPDHYTYDEYGLRDMVNRYKADTVIVTAKDAVKIKGIVRDTHTAWLFADIAISMDGKTVKEALRKKGMM